MKLVGQQKPELLLTETHHMCPGCGEPLALRGYLEAIQELGLSQRTIAVAGIGCYTSFSMTTDVDLVQALHGRAPSVATGVKRMLKRAFQTQDRREGFTFVEVLTMCPTGWFIPTAEGPDYMSSTLGEVHIMGELKADGVVKSTEELHEENVRKAAEMEQALARGGIDP